MTSDFTFNDKTGELSRGGKIISLCRMHAQIFDCLAKAQAPISSYAIERAIGAREKTVYFELPALCRRLRPLGISIATAQRKRWLVFEEPAKWQPDIPPPVRLEGEV